MSVRARSSSWLKPGWPLAALFAGLPLWWVLGLKEYAFFILTVPMAAHLFRQRQVAIPRGFGVWLLFLVWMAAGVFALQVDAPGTQTGDSAARYLTFGYRLFWYLISTVVLLYVGNTRSILSTERIVRALGYGFLVIAGGGLLGVLLPTLEFPSLLELVLPRSVANNGFIRSQIHPVAAQIQDFLGYVEPRPSAPFNFSNVWGLHFACTLPFFVLSWCRRDAGWRRIAAPFILLIAAVPVVSSLNRGLWGALIAMALFLAVRYAVMGRLATLVGVLASIVLLGVVVLASPLGQLVSDRLATPHSNEGRTNLGTLTATSVLEGSPAIGFGTTRNVRGSFSSIAAGSTAECPRCGAPPPLGTQGQLWVVLFATGLGGLVLYLSFLLPQFFRHLHHSSSYSIAALCVLIVHFVTMPVYNSVGSAFFIAMIAMGILWRENTRLRSAADSPVAYRTLGSMLGSARRWIVPIVALAAIGGVVGAAWQYSLGTPTSARQSVFIPPDGTRVETGSRPMSMDTEAQVLMSDPVLKAVASATGNNEPLAKIAERVKVTAIPNTRILRVLYTDSSVELARLGVSALTTAFFEVRRQLIVDQRAADLKALQAGGDAVVAQLRTARTALQNAGAAANPALRKSVAQLRFQAREISVTVARLSTANVSGGQIAQSTQVIQSHDSWMIRIGSGVAISLTLALSGAWLLDGPTRRIGRRPGRTLPSDLPVLARLSADSGRGGPLTAQAGLRSYAPLAAVVPDPKSHDAGRLARSLTADLTAASATGARALLVATTKSRTRDITRLQAAMERSGQHVVGLVLLDE